VAVRLACQPRDLKHARSIVRRVCRFAGHVTCIDDLRHDALEAGLIAAVKTRNTPLIFDWLMGILSYQGISDAVARRFMDEHGNVTWAEISRALDTDSECEKLQGYWAFTGCLYQKTAQTCAKPNNFGSCPLPRHNLRNGRLNQTAYSLFLFIRDVAGGDIVRWIDQQITVDGRHNLAAARAALVDPLRYVYGVSDKVIAMALAMLLMGAGEDRPGWFDVGASFIVVDTLVHNFLARTGIGPTVGIAHPYGPACYRLAGCADVVAGIAATIDVRQFNPTFPKTFPWFVQHAIWRYCAQSCFDVCNGNQIDDSGRCTNMWCRLYAQCDRLVLRESAKTS
jgi:hypothetical protein